MYFQTTLKCNMRCAHCCFSCTDKGKDMSLATFKKALALAENYGETIEIGGGEPTLHPSFWEILGLAISVDAESPPWLATNGKITNIALRLAAMAKKGVISVRLSRDEYHEEIDPRVIEAFTKNRARSHPEYGNDYNNDCREVWKGPFHSLVNAGRARRLRNVEKNKTCPCATLFIDPSGDIWECGCKKVLIGNVHTLTEIPEEYTNDDNYGGEEHCTKSRLKYEHMAMSA